MRKNILFCIVLFLSLLSLQAQRIIPCGCNNTAVYKGEKEWSDSLFVQRNLRAQQAPPRIPWVEQGCLPTAVPVIINENMETFYTGYREDWAAGPFNVYGRGYFASPTNVKMALYIPKPAVEFPDHNKRFYMQGFTECPGEEIDYSNFQKVYEFPGTFEATKSSDGNYYDTGEIIRDWDGMSSPQFTGGVSKPVYDCTALVLENAETGEILNTTLGPATSPLSRYYTGLRKSVEYNLTQPHETSVTADVYFASKLPISRVTAFLVDDFCSVPTIKWTDFQVSGEQALLGSSLGNEGSALKAYKMFDNAAQYLERAEDGLYHLTWEIMGRNGKPYNRGNNTSRHYLGLIIEGTGTVVDGFDYNTAVNMTGKDGLITDIDMAHWEDQQKNPIPALSTNAIETWEQNNGIEINAIPGGVRIATRNGFSAGSCIVYGVSGKKIFQQEIKGSGMEITSLPPGAYVVQVHSREAVKTEKIIVQK